MIIEKLNKSHIESAAKLVAGNYKNELMIVSALPDNDYFDYFCKKINETIENGYGIAAMEANELKGFLSGVTVDSFKGLNRGIYVPIEGHAAKDDKQDIYQRMYESIGDVWVKNGCLTHAISIFAHETETVETWFQQGFGNRCVDAVRPLTEVYGKKASQYEIRRAVEEDAKVLLPLFMEHSKYYSRAPLFMCVFDIDDLVSVKNDIASGNVWAAFDNDRPVAYMILKKGGEYFVADDVKTINLCSAYAYEEVRGTGVCAAMLETIIAWVSKNGYERLGVDYESFNRLGSRFWGKHFTPFAYCLFRRLDERITWANSERQSGIVI